MRFALNDNDNSSYSIVIKDIYSSGCIIRSQDIARYHYSLPVTTSSQSLSVILLGGMVVATVNTGLGDNRLIIGASVSEPHTSESNWDFSYIIIIIIYLPYVRRSVNAG